MKARDDISKNQVFYHVIVWDKFNSYIQIIRPYQWIKNLLVFAPIFFAGRLTEWNLLRLTIETSVIFCAVASLGYILNDWMDRDQDSCHPEKCKRPIPTGRLTRRDLLLLVALLGSVTVLLSVEFAANPSLIACILSYLALTTIYSLGLKNIESLEIFMVACFFVLRVMAGGLATGIPVSDWLFLTVFFLALLITLAKRKSELVVLHKDAHNHRRSLTHYSSAYLNHFLWTTGGISILAYGLYVVGNKNNIIYSIIPATYGIARFLLLVDKGKGGDPILTLVKDPHLVLTVLIFFGFICYHIYG
jgi:decaprenyl-phosphate phosphoribosyltransferase